MAKYICSHPNMVPTAWEQKKPKPVEMSVCACGMNVVCPICGYGWGTWPCKCDRKRERYENRTN